MANKSDTKLTKNKKVAPVQLFEKFGEFDGFEELNKAAAGQLEEGDIEALRALAKENGIEADETEDYIEGIVPELVTPMTAALGRLRIEFETFKSLRDGEKEACVYIAKMVSPMLIVEEFAKAVTKKGKRVHTIEQAMYDARVACGTDDDLRKIISAYYLEGEEKMKEIIKEVKEAVNDESI